MAETTIEWTDRTWNPLRGCSKVSEGCRNCYAIKMAHRFSGPGQPYEGLTKPGPGGPNWTGKVMLLPDVLEHPLRWRKPQRVFVNSMSDLFHPEVPDEFIDQVFAVMALAPEHTFQILTKRPERMQEYLSDRKEVIEETIAFNTMGVPSRDIGKLWGGWTPAQTDEYGRVEVPGYFDDVNIDWPLPNVWIGVSVENEQAADERIHWLNKTPAAVRFLSCEPLLGPLDLRVHLNWKSSQDWKTPLISWVIAGGESGPGARPMHPDWARSLRDQCQATGVAFHFKQHGEFLLGRRVREIELPAYTEDARDGIITLTRIDPPSEAGKKTYVAVDSEGCAYELKRVGKKSAGRLLDGRTWDEFPQV